MRVLMLGATGFIGTRVADELVLRRGIAVRAIVRDYRTAVRLGRLPIDLVEGSATDPLAMREAARTCDAVVHGAHPFTSPSETAALDLCRAAAAASEVTATRRLVYVSTTAVYGLGGGDITEDTLPRPDTPYGRLKLRCERLLSRRHEAGSLRLIILRPSVVYGPFGASWTVLPARQMSDGNLVLPLDAPGACNAIYVDDVAQSVARAITLDTRAAVALNLAGGDRPSWRAFYGAYEECVRPGAITEWPIDAIRDSVAARQRDRRNWRAVQRALRDRRVRDRLNEIPLLAGLNTLGKSLGWRGLPASDVLAPRRENDDATPPTLVDHLPDPLRLDLYLRAPLVDGAAARRLLGLRSRSLQAGMVPTQGWLQWAGLAETPVPARSA